MDMKWPAICNHHFQTSFLYQETLSKEESSSVLKRLRNMNPEPFRYGQDSEIRTRDLLHPMQALYQAALYPGEDHYPPKQFILKEGKKRTGLFPVRFTNPFKLVFTSALHNTACRDLNGVLIFIVIFDMTERISCMETGIVDRMHSVMTGTQ
jgi:hypothetical protein